MNIKMRRLVENLNARWQRAVTITMVYIHEVAFRTSWIFLFLPKERERSQGTVRWRCRHRLSLIFMRSFMVLIHTYA